MIVVLSLVPGTHLGPLLQLPHAETVLHFAGYAAIVASAALFCRRAGELAAIAIACVFVASALELVQLLVPERGPSLGDTAANAAGAASGYIVARMAGRLGRLATGRTGTTEGSQAEEG